MLHNWYRYYDASIGRVNEDVAISEEINKLESHHPAEKQPAFYKGYINKLHQRRADAMVIRSRNLASMFLNDFIPAMVVQALVLL